jgi:hypothetical protein
MKKKKTTVILTIYKDCMQTVSLHIPKQKCQNALAFLLTELNF